jgi:hypothetical protein
MREPYLTGNPRAVDINEEEYEAEQTGVSSSKV